MLTLRPYQLDAIEQIRQRVRDGKRRVLLIAPTGAGKTVMASEIIRGAVSRGRRVVFIAHRRELIDQAVSKLAACDVWASVVMAADPRHDPLAPVQVCSVQTLARRLSALPPADLLIIDEAHHATATTYRALVEHYASATVIGLTATPWLLGRGSLADIFDASVIASTPADLIASGSLVPYEAHAYVTPDLSSVRTVAGDYDRRGLHLACDTPTVVGSVVAEYQQHAAGRRAILFPASVEASRHLVEEFRGAGVQAAHVDCETPADERAGTLAALASGDMLVVSSVGVLSEGFDCPAAEVCLLARPTKSLSLYLQMVGRVLRPSPGKVRALIHDHAGNCIAHGLPDDPRDYSLAAKPICERQPLTCPFCSAIFHRQADGRCPSCWQLVAPPAAPAQRTGVNTVVDGRRVSIDRVRRFAAARSAAGLRELTTAQLIRVMHATREEKLAEYKRLVLVQLDRGFKHGFAARCYRDCFGSWPRFGDAELDAATPADKPFLPLPPKESHARHTTP